MSFQDSIISPPLSPRDRFSSEAWQLGAKRYGRKYDVSTFDDDPGRAKRLFNHTLGQLAADIAREYWEVPHSIMYTYSVPPRLDDWTPVQRHIIEAIVSPVAITEVQVITEIRSLVPMKYKCNYCGGYTLDDAVGNCAACGARREEF